MKKIISFIFLLCIFHEMQGMLKEFVEQGVTTNRFLDKYSGGSCPISAGTQTNSTNCGNSDIYNVIGANFITGSMSTLGTYIIYNDFGTYVEEMSRDFNNSPPGDPDQTLTGVDYTFERWSDEASENLDGLKSTDGSSVEDTQILTDLTGAAATGDSSSSDSEDNSGGASKEDYPAVGIYQLELSTINSVQATVLPDLEVVEGATKLVARLRYNGGTTYSQDSSQEIYLWSEDAIYLQPTDSFKIIISNEVDDRVATLNSKDSDSVVGGLNQYFNYSENIMTAGMAYQKAVNSPRKVRLEKIS